MLVREVPDEGCFTSCFTVLNYYCLNVKLWLAEKCFQCRQKIEKNAQREKSIEQTKKSTKIQWRSGTLLHKTLPKRQTNNVVVCYLCCCWIFRKTHKSVHKINCFWYVFVTLFELFIGYHQFDVRISINNQQVSKDWPLTAKTLNNSIHYHVLY